MEDKDEEISIDFSKLTSFFKGKQEKPEGSPEPANRPKSVAKPVPKAEKTQDSAAEKETEEDISVDFSKLTSLFKPKAGDNSKAVHQEGRSHRESAEENSEISLDFGKVKDFFGKIHPNFLVLLLVLIPLTLGLYIRLQTADLHVTDTWARNTVYNYYQNSIRDQVNQQYPTLPEARKNEILTTEFNKFLKEQGSQVEPQIADLSARFKQEFKDDNGNNYMPDIDTYYWLRFIDNLDQKGHLGDQVINGSQFDDHFNFPFGRFVPQDEYFHIYLGYYFYKAVKLFDSGVIPMVAFAYLPIFLFALCTIFIFFITKRIAGSTGGFFAALLLAVVPYFVTKSAAGYADTDIEVVFFPLLITFLFLEAFESKKLLKSIILGTLSGLATAVFSITWSGWWYIFDFLVGATGLYLVYYLAINRNKLSEHQTQKSAIGLAIPFIIFVISTSVFAGMLTVPDAILISVWGPLHFTNIKDVATLIIWPNVYTTVAEQNVIPLSDLINNIGGKVLFALSIMGIVLTLTKKDKHGHIDIKYALLLAFWFASTLYASTKGLRFILVIVPAFSIGFGVFVGLMSQYIANFMEKELSLAKKWGIVILAVLFVLTLIPSYRNAYAITTSSVPDISDAWVRSLVMIKDNATEPAVINSWWDFGHWFKYWADIPVTFDGTSQQTPKAHWVGKVLLTEDEDEAIAILRLLDCGGDYIPLNTLDARFKDTMKSVELMKREIMLDKGGAVKLLVSEGFDKKTAEEIVSVTHCEPPENFLITSGDMVQKSGVWAHFGSWNFTKADMMLRVKPLNAVEGKQLLSERYGIPPTQQDKYYYDIETQDANNWIADWPSIASTPSSCTNSSGLIVCSDGLRFNLTTQELYGQTPTGKQYPSRYSFVDSKGKFRIKESNSSLITSGNGQPLGAAIVKIGESYSTIMMSPELVGSMFTRLFYFQGAGLKHFDHFYSDRDVRGTEIYTWKVDWEGK